MSSNIKIIGKYREMKQFETVDEFNKYYAKHKEEIDAKTSNQLNKELKIRGYKITKRNVKMIDDKKFGELCLKPITKDEADTATPGELRADTKKDFEERITQLEIKINQIIDAITPIISAAATTSYSQN